jgi:hypothetical protein
MCCLSQPVEVVSDTSIFARGTNGRQFLVSSMRFAAATDPAMALPLPVWLPSSSRKPALS